MAPVLPPIAPPPREEVKPKPEPKPDAAAVATFKSGVSNVRVDVQVTENNEVLTGLTKENFTVYEQGKPQEIVYFGRDREPLSLLLLLDVSGSMRKYLDQMAGVARQSLRFLRPRDRVAVMIFSKETSVIQPFTENLDEVARALARAVWDDKLGSGTEINNAILDAAQYLENQTEETGRKAVLMLTDNLGLNYRSPDRKAINALYNADAVFNALVVGRAERPAEPRPGVYTNPDFTPPNVFLIADETGGEAVKADRANQAFPVMVERIRTRYALSYRTPADPKPGFRAIRVELSPAAKLEHPNARVRHRKGYFAKGD